MPRRAHRFVLPWLLLLFVAAACGSSSSGGASQQCSKNSDCVSGLSCIPLATFNDAGCSQSGKACSKACTTDGDCASLGSTYKCFSSCPGSPMFCAATQ